MFRAVRRGPGGDRVRDGLDDLHAPEEVVEVTEFRGETTIIVKPGRIVTSFVFGSKKTLLLPSGVTL